MSAHSPLPWRARRTGGCFVITSGLPGRMGIVATVDLAIDAGGNQEAEADAEFIVRAANAHADLLEALNGILSALTQNATFPADVELARSYARRAIAKAGEP